MFRAPPPYEGEKQKREQHDQVSADDLPPASPAIRDDEEI
jgi:hypothetical protein